MSRWVQLTDEGDGSPVYVNGQLIVAAYAEMGGTRLLLNNGGHPLVREQLDQVMLKLEASQT